MDPNGIKETTSLIESSVKKVEELIFKVKNDYLSNFNLDYFYSFLYSLSLLITLFVGLLVFWMTSSKSGQQKYVLYLFTTCGGR